MKLQQQSTLADSICDTRTRKIKKVFFGQSNILLDWKSISILLDKHYKKGAIVDASVINTPLNQKEKQFLR